MKSIIKLVIILLVIFTMSCNSISYQLGKAFGGPIMLDSIVGESKADSVVYLKRNNFILLNETVLPVEKIVNINLYEYQSNLVNFKFKEDDLVIEETWQKGDDIVHIWYLNKITIDNVCYNSKWIKF